MPREIFCAETASPDETRALAAALAGCLIDGDLLVLTGELGAGKTCFTQGLGAGLGVVGPVTSPTFVIAAVYRGRLTLNHLDAYRIDPGDDAGDLDLPELLERGVTVIEWGERLVDLLPSDHLAIDIAYGDEVDLSSSVGTGHGTADGGADDGSDDLADDVAEPGRSIRLSASGPRWADRLDGIAEVLGPWRASC